MDILCVEGVDEIAGVVWVGTSRRLGGRGCSIGCSLGFELGVDWSNSDEQCLGECGADWWTCVGMHCVAAGSSGLCVVLEGNNVCEGAGLSGSEQVGEKMSQTWAK